MNPTVRGQLFIVSNGFKSEGEWRALTRKNDKSGFLNLSIGYIMTGVKIKYSTVYHIARCILFLKQVKLRDFKLVVKRQTLLDMG
jgi:hypothetical protein